MSIDDLEKLVAKFYRINNLWSQPRSPSSVCTLPRARTLEGSTTSLLGLEVLLDRWLLVLRMEGRMEIHDLSPSNPILGGIEAETTILSSTVSLDCDGWGSYAARADQDSGLIYIALVRTVETAAGLTGARRPFHLDLWQFSVDGAIRGQRQDDKLLKRLMRRTLDVPKLVRDIDPTKRLVALSALTAVELLPWDDGIANSPTVPGTIPVPGYDTDSDDYWNGIVKLQFLGPFMLIAKTRSVELHHYSPALATNTGRFPLLRHTFEHRTFREVVFSHCKHSKSDFKETWEVKMLASDVIHGLFQFEVKVTLPLANPATTASSQSDIHPHLDVELTGLYPLSLLIPPAPCPPKASGYLMNREDTGTPTPASSHLHFQNGFGPFGHKSPSSITRGFLSTFCIGPQGKRALWVERARSSISREVQVWDQGMVRERGSGSTLLESSSSTRERTGAPIQRMIDSWAVQFGHRCVEMEKNVVYKAVSYDLRETMGTIVLGTRAGNIRVLPLEVRRKGAAQ
ncbi:hypothetical protein CC1G_08345 [Coprinopsis cinerea okayama7|uniref:Uncharacterized protein n=1 Tax=Coprinopsis cinerea (strain Okayama-7 / 130 / ATCC MYA-4618 / FGSC 9003) TaxID=240176 RepID=A8NA88_COPC7|nr:hypothetical protein CC1G_08345 [Coprinopsis cinerea okayama7\|eukprot:XP_001831741.2 hypothetical protein CC1G_08345 [Coprinopsis cinerea okayama7\